MSFGDAPFDIFGPNIIKGSNEHILLPPLRSYQHARIHTGIWKHLLRGFDVSDLISIPVFNLASWSNGKLGAKRLQGPISGPEFEPSPRDRTEKNWARSHLQLTVGPVSAALPNVSVPPPLLKELPEAVGGGDDGGGGGGVGLVHLVLLLLLPLWRVGRLGICKDYDFDCVG